MQNTSNLLPLPCFIHTPSGQEQCWYIYQSYIRPIYPNSQLSETFYLPRTRDLTSQYAKVCNAKGKGKITVPLLWSALWSF